MIEEKEPRPMEEPQGGTPEEGKADAERYSPEHPSVKIEHFEVPNGVMNIVQNTNMIAPKGTSKRKIPEHIKRDLPAYQRGKPQSAVFIPDEGFYYSDGTRATFTKSQLCDLIGLCKAFKMLLNQDAELLEYKEGLGRGIWEDEHSFLNEKNTIRMKLSTFSRISRGDERGGQSEIKDNVHHNLAFFGTLYGRYLRGIVKSKNLEEVNEPIIKYVFTRESKYNEKTKETKQPITYIEITLNDAFIYQGKGYTSFPDNFADLVYKHGRDSAVFSYLLFDIIKQRGLRDGAFKSEAKVIEEGKGTKKEKGIAKGKMRNAERRYRHTQKYLLEKVLGDDKSIYYDGDKFRTTRWRKHLREAIQSYVQMGLVDDTSRYGDGHGTYIDNDGGLGCDLRINLKW